jgi:hypothetical protein
MEIQIQVVLWDHRHGTDVGLCITDDDVKQCQLNQMYTGWENGPKPKDAEFTLENHARLLKRYEKNHEDESWEITSYPLPAQLAALVRAAQGAVENIKPSSVEDNEAGDRLYGSRDQLEAALKSLTGEPVDADN